MSFTASIHGAFGAGPGYTIGCAAALVILLVGIAINLRDRRHKGTNAKCALGTIFALLACMSTVVGIFLSGIPDFAGPLTICGPVAFVLLIIGLLVALQGLKEQKQFPGRWPRGRRRARAILALPVVAAVLIVGSVITHSVGHPLFSALIRGTAGHTVIDKERNFRIDAPPPWVATEPAKLNPAACAGFARLGPEMFATVVAENRKDAPNASLHSAVAAARARLNRETGSQFLEEYEQNENGLTGHRIESIFTAGDQRFVRIQWLTEHGGIFYEVSTWGPPEVRDKVRLEALKFTGSFRVLESKVSPPPFEAAPATFTSKAFGYSVDLTNTIWTRRWSALEKENPFAEFGVLNARNSAAFCVIPVWIGDDTLDFEALAGALTARLGIPFTPETIFADRNVRQGPVRGRAFAAEKTEKDVRLLYRMRVLRGRGFAYLLAAWMNKALESSSEPLDLALDCVSFAEAPTPDPLITGDRLRFAHSIVWNEIGTALFRAGKFDAAPRWFQRAFEIEPTNAMALANYAEGAMKLGRPGDAVAWLDKHIPAFPGNNSLAALRASALLQSGDTDGAISAYRGVFDAGFRDDQLFTRYLSALVSRKRLDDALATLDRYAEGHDTPQLRNLRTQLLDLRRGSTVR